MVVNLPLADFGRFCFFDSGGILRDSHTPFPHVNLPHNPNGIDCIFGTLDEVALAPTCRSEGRVVYRCNDNCGLTSTFFIAAVSHDYVLGSNGKYYCKHCGQPML